jgi:hypothetical protein
MKCALAHPQYRFHLVANLPGRGLPRYLDLAPGKVAGACKEGGHERRKIFNHSRYTLLGSQWSNKTHPDNWGHWMHFGVPGPHFLLLLENVPIEMCNKPYERKFNPPRDLDSKTPY